MGIYDRSYMREPQPDQRFGARHANWWLDHFNYVFIALCVLGWFLINASLPQGGDQSGGLLTDFSAWTCLTWEGLTQGRVWTLLSYTFVDPNLYSLFFNMLLLWYFGEEIQSLYGRANLVWVYTLATLVGAGAFLATAALEHADPGTVLIGAGPLVMCVLVIVTCWFPRRLIYVLGIIPCPLILLTGLYVALDLTALRGMGEGRGWVAASLSGAGLGLAFFFLDLRLSRRHAIGAWLRPSSNLRRLFDHRGQRRQKAAAAEGKVLDMYSFTARPGDGPHEPGRPPVSAADAKRVDALLDKIAKQGREGLTAEELEFLQRASKKYR